MMERQGWSYDDKAHQWRHADINPIARWVLTHPTPAHATTHECHGLTAPVAFVFLLDFAHVAVHDLALPSFFLLTR
jgi:hypothetical protein